MSLLANIMVGVVAAIHVYILVLEMYLWDKPAGLRAFGQSLEQARASKVLAANQGLYNGFLAAGLIWGLLADHGSSSPASSSPACTARRLRAGRFSGCRRCRRSLPWCCCTCRDRVDPTPMTPA